MRKRSCPAVSYNVQEDVRSVNQNHNVGVVKGLHLPRCSTSPSSRPPPSCAPTRYAINTLRVSRPRTSLNTHILTRKSTPIVAVASSSGSHCSSEKRSNKLLFPTDEFPIIRSFTFTGAPLAMVIFKDRGWCQSRARGVIVVQREINPRCSIKEITGERI